MSQALRPARAVAPGRVLSRELEARGLSQKELAEIMGRPPQAINEIIRGTKRITPETALELAAAFETSAELWLNLEANYRLHLARQGSGQEEIARRGRLYAHAPIRELLGRGWIRATSSLDDLEREVCAFLGISSLGDSSGLAVSIRHARERGPELNAQIAWVKRVEALAGEQAVGSFDPTRLRNSLQTVLALAARAEDVALVPSTLLALGVHFVIVPQLDRTYLDGAAWVLDGHPLVALTLRYDRVDCFWFTLAHELAHVLASHEGVYLDDLKASDNQDARTPIQEELEANRCARDWLLEPAVFEAFVSKAGPFFSKASIERFATSQGRHPGIVLGQLQHRGLVGYSYLGRLLVKVRPFLEDWIDSPGPQMLAAAVS